MTSILGPVKSSLARFRSLAFLEGISFLVLLGIAMPLKYFADMPSAVKYVGWLHGVLFVAYLAWLLVCWMEYSWSIKKVALLVLASLLPFGPFVADRWLLRK